MVFLMGNYTGPWGITFNPFLIAQSGKPFNITTEYDLTGDNFFNDRPSYAASSSDCAVTSGLFSRALRWWSTVLWLHTKAWPEVRDDTPKNDCRTTLAALNLTAIDARLETLLESASKKEPSYGDFLFEVMSAEADARRQRYLKTRLQLAHLPYVKTFDQFDFAFQPSIDERQIRELRTLRFVHEASNVILLGPPGVGKTHLAVALAETAIQSGQAAYFMTAHDLVTDLGRAYREGRLDRRLRIYLAPKVLIIDEMGYLPLDDLGATIFFQLVSARYETRQHHSYFQQELRRMGYDLRRSDHRHGHPRPAAAPFDDGEHSRRKLPAQRAPQGRADSFAGTATGRSAAAAPSGRGKRNHSL